MFCPSVRDDVIAISDTAVYDGFSVKGFADVTAADYSIPSLCGCGEVYVARHTASLAFRHPFYNRGSECDHHLSVCFCLNHWGPLVSVQAQWCDAAIMLHAHRSAPVTFDGWVESNNRQRDLIRLVQGLWKRLIVCLRLSAIFCFT